MTNTRRLTINRYKLNTSRAYYKSNEGAIELRRISKIDPVKQELAIKKMINTVNTKLENGYSKSIRSEKANLERMLFDLATHLYIVKNMPLKSEDSESIDDYMIALFIRLGLV